MKSSLFIAYILLAATVPVLAHDCHGRGHWQGCYPAHDCYRSSDSAGPGPSASQEALSGTISEVVRTGSITQVWVKTAQGTVLVRLGPAGFLEQGGILLNEGDRIDVKGYRPAWSADDLVVATEVSTSNRTLALRSGRGRPLW